ncbi:Glycosyltransferase Family 4 [Mucilaginibacter sp. OK268]|uniref:glycosyltransferase n=1 Tax=Mucilaginibacter sp. OK268 TaxID=1881048 RepID=UPI00088FC136|nr:glycosyltransferase [Mucilaginibacter sp. OK268]SDQ00416.1 Glycosyltransferase Family 4 [Mucilaginibacter sp. OK268]
MKNLLIISPYFPPGNAADMQRVRMSLPYFASNGWNVEVVMVDENYTDIQIDPLLLESIPNDIKIHKVKALNKRWTSKLGLGSIALRSSWFYRHQVNRLLKNGKFDLIYFSTTQFPVCILGAYWKKKFGVPYVIDMQDPWHSDYYQNKPRAQQPPKYWFSYRLNKYLEPIAIKNADGLISVSEAYIDDLKNRYPSIKNRPSAVITFGAFEPDLSIARENQTKFVSLLDPRFINIVYTGRGGVDMHQAITPVFEAFKKGLSDKENAFYRRLKFYFIGTSYAPAGQGKPTILPLAQQYGIADHVVEITDRISYYHTLLTLLQASALFIPGSDDPQYTASKIYPYLLTQKPLLAIFNGKSSAIPILREYGVRHVYDYENVRETNINDFFSELNNGDSEPVYDQEAINKYSAQQMTVNQCLLFNQVLNLESRIKS